jgi:LuxR family maltose regulon positive regulatory protein
MAVLKGGFASIVDYLIEEVLSQQSPEMARLMVATAILDHFCAPLCDALQGMDAAPGTGEMNGDEFIARLQKDNLFLFALDTRNRWFRYHHLFQQLLQDQLNRYWCPEEIAALHSRAKAWFAENDIIDDTIKHPLAAFEEKDEQVVAPEAAGQPTASAQQPLVEPLSNRELDVLELLPRRLSNQEIADKLCISAQTVKSHLKNIYGKLSVNKRREAVEKAMKIGIL